MTSTEPFTPSRPDDTLDEILPLVGTVPVYGPPIIVLAGPWLFLCLMLVGPFALLVTFGLLLAVAATVVALAGAILMAPFVLARRVHRSLAARAEKRAGSPQVATGAAGWGTA